MFFVCCVIFGCSQTTESATRTSGGSPWDAPPPPGADLQLGVPFADVHVRDLAWSADSRRLYTVPGPVQWDAQTGWPVRRLTEHPIHASSVLATSDRSALVMGERIDDHAVLVVLPLPAGTPRRFVVEPSADLRALTPDNKQAIVTVDTDGPEVAIAYDLETGLPAARWTTSGEDCGSTGISFLPDGRLLIGAEGFGIGDRAGGHVELVDVGVEGCLAEVASAPDGQTLALGRWWPPSIFGVDNSTREPRWSLGWLLRGEGIAGVAFDRDGDRVVAGWGQGGSGSPDMVGVWEVPSGRPLAQWPGSDPAFSPDGTMLAWETHRGVGVTPTRALAVGPPKETRLDVHSSITSLDFSDDGTALLVSDERGDVAVWDPASGQLQRWLDNPRRGPRVAAWRRGEVVDGEAQRVSLGQSIVREVQVGPAGQLAVLFDDQLWVDDATWSLERLRDIAWSPDGRLAVRGGSGFWVLDGGTLEERDAHCRDLTWAGSSLLCLQTRSVSDLDSDRFWPLTAPSGPFGAHGAQASPDGRWLVVRHEEQTQLVDLETGEVVGTTAAGTVVAWTRDSSQWALGRDDGTVLISSTP